MKKKTTRSTNDFFKFIEDVEKRPDEYSDKIVKQVALQRKMLKKYDFIEEKGKKCVDWIEKYCYLTEGEKAGSRVKLMLWQKWIIYSIFCFYGDIETEIFDENGEYLGIGKKYQRIVNDVLIVIGSGNSKTTFIAFVVAYVMYSNCLPSPKVYIGSNAYKQSKICFDVVKKVIERSPVLSQYAKIRQTIGEIEIPQTNAKVIAMSSQGDNYEGIIPALLIIDEIHAMPTNTYASNLRKSTKRSDKLIIELTTQGICRGGYLDERLELANSLLNEESPQSDDKKFFAIFEQKNEEEVFKAFETNDIKIWRKANPSLGVAVSVEELKDKVKAMINDPKQKVTTLTKNFNIPQNPITSYFSEIECRTKPFNEAIFYGAPIFLGLDMAYTRNPSNDLTCLKMLMVNPFTGEEYSKDFYFLPRWYEEEIKNKDEIEIIKKDMLIEKSKVDTNILYNKRQKKYGYEMYAKRGDLVVLDEDLRQEMSKCFGQEVFFDMTGITEDFILLFITYLENKYKWILCKFGLDPNKASKISSVSEKAIRSLDTKNPVIQFRMENKKISNPIIVATKDIRSQRKVYNNNRLTELHFANAQAKEDQFGSITFVNPKYARKDGVIAELSARSAYNVFTTNKDTGEANTEFLKNWWKTNEVRINGLLERT
ncbi:MAG: phage terminase family protein [Solobacterium sp.]|nr:phage terminase family protein [Solobacterium sp.]